MHFQSLLSRCFADSRTIIAKKYKQELDIRVEATVILIAWCCSWGCEATEWNQGVHYDKGAIVHTVFGAGSRASRLGASWHGSFWQDQQTPISISDLLSLNSAHSC